MMQLKKHIAADLRKYAMASIDPVIVRIQMTSLSTLRLFALLRYWSVDLIHPKLKSDIDNAGILDWAKQTQINNFNSTFRASTDFEKAVTLVK